MRRLTRHIVAGDLPQNQLEISVMDEPGAGGACHRYVVRAFDTSGNPSSFNGDRTLNELLILFQNGPIKEVGRNGVTHEALLVILIDRLRHFQSGPYICRENALALTKLEEALMWLQQRTTDRLQREVEGTNRL